MRVLLMGFGGACLVLAAIDVKSHQINLLNRWSLVGLGLVLWVIALWLG